MVFKLYLQTFFVSLVIVAFLFGESYHLTEGFKVSLQLYFNTTTDGDFLDFESNHADLNGYDELLPRVKLACGRGRWNSYTGASYTGTRAGLGSVDSNQTVCESLNAANIKSIRYHGVSETTKDSLSLYEGLIYTGKEILVEGQAFAGITTPVKSLAATGNSEWKLFQGPLEGKSVCIQVPNPEYFYYWQSDVQLSLGLTTIGSVFKGCNILEN